MHTTVHAAMTDSTSDTCAHEGTHRKIKSKGDGSLRGMTRQQPLNSSMRRFDVIMESDALNTKITDAKGYSRVSANTNIPMEIRVHIVEPAVIRLGANLSRAENYDVIPTSPSTENGKKGAVLAFVLQRKAPRERFSGTPNWTPTRGYAWSVDFYKSAVVTVW